MSSSNKANGKSEKGGMGGGLVPGTYPAPKALRPTLVGESWSVVAGHPRTSLVAAEIFRAGGNAIDAGVAAGIASNVVQVDMANFGGIAPILIREAAAQSAWSVAGIGRWSKSASLEEMLKRYGGSLPLYGAPAIVPGAPAGWIAALKRFGTMSFSQVATPAIKLAHEGFLVDQSLATSLEITGRNFQKWPTSAAIYRPDGKSIAPGQRLKQEKLAELLQRLVDAETAHNGNRAEKLSAAHKAFYEGEVAQILTDSVTSRGGYMTLDDLAEFEAEIETAPSVEIKGWRFFATPSWSQGPTALQILGILARTSGSWHELVESITLAFNDREDFLAAPGQMKRDLLDLISDQHLEELAGLIGESSLAGRPGKDLATKPLSSTTAVVTMDSEGNTFATSPSDTIDGGPIIPELGILCSPRGVQSRLEFNHPNRLTPGGRPVVTPAAMIGLRDGESWALACPGGDVIVQAMAQVIWKVVNESMELQESVESPRIAAFNAPSAFHPHPSADRLVYAEKRIGEDAIDKLRKHGHTVQVWPEYEFDAGSVQTIKSSRNSDGERTLFAAADPRRSAYGLAE
ncbi:MAG: gamma-glutamyltransferase family protein [Actinomycetota bacterium]